MADLLGPHPILPGYGVSSDRHWTGPRRALTVRIRNRPRRHSPEEIAMAGIERHALHGRIVKDFERPSAELVKRFEKHDTAKLVDSMGGYGAMHFEIKPLENHMRILGTA